MHLPVRQLLYKELQQTQVTFGSPEFCYTEVSL